MHSPQFTLTAAGDVVDQWKIRRRLAPEDDVELHFNVVQLIVGNGFGYVVEREQLIRDEVQ